MKKAIRYLIPSFFCLQLLISQNLFSQLPYTELNDSIIFFDNFDSYSPGVSLYGQNPDDWFMFTGAPGSFSPIITDTFSFSNPNAVAFNYSWETIIKPIDNYDTGIYFIDFLLYFPQNKTGTFYTFNYFDGEDIIYGMQVAFSETGQGAIFTGGFDSTGFDYSYSTWLFNRVIVDLNTDWAAYYLNENVICSWIWSSGMYGGSGPNLLGGSEFIGHYYGDTEFLLDDYKLTRVDNSVFFDYFEIYDSNEQLACQNPNRWTTWNNLPCSMEDPFVIDTFAFESSKSVLIRDSNNLVRPIDNLTEGIYKISFQMFIPVGEQGVFSVLQEFDGNNSKVGGQMNFDSDGYIYFDVGSLGEPGIYNPGTWMKNNIIIDLNEDWAEYYLDDIQFIGWQWSLGAFGTNNLNQLAGMNFKTYSWIIDEAKYFIDDFSVTEIDSIPCYYPPQNLTYSVTYPDTVLLSWEPPNCPDLLGYNVYFEGALLDFTATTSYLITLPPGSYEMCIIAVYEMGGSDCAWITIILTDKKEIETPKFTIYPNPTDKVLIIDSESEITNISIFTLSGQLQMELFDIKDQEYIVNISKLSPGIYLIRIKTKIKTTYRRIIIK